MPEAMSPLHDLHQTHADQFARRKLIGPLPATPDRSLGHRATFRAQQVEIDFSVVLLPAPLPPSSATILP